MDILIRIIIMIFTGILIPYLSNIIYEPLKHYKELTKIEKILWGLGYIFIINWIIITPSILFFDCFKYIFIR